MKEIYLGINKVGTKLWFDGPLHDYQHFHNWFKENGTTFGAIHKAYKVVSSNGDIYKNTNK